MKIAPTAMAAVAAVVTTGFVGIATASIAAADVAAAGITHPFGSQATVNTGDVVQGWTVSDLKPSSDAIPYPVQGKLWEATATDVAMQGYVVPMVSDLNARSATGQTYRALYQVATPQGVNPATLAPGEKTTGKVYFDVTGDKPDSVVYVDAENQDMATWVQPPPPQGRVGTAAPAAAPASAPAAAAGSAPAAAPGTPGAPAAPASAGSQGTPEGTAATPAPEGTTATPAPEGAAATPAPAAVQEAPATTAATPAPGGSQGTPEGGSSAPAS